MSTSPPTAYRWVPVKIASGTSATVKIQRRYFYVKVQKQS